MILNKHYNDLKNGRNSDLYKNDMNKIVMSDELKAKILSAAAEKIKSTENSDTKVIKIKSKSKTQRRRTVIHIGTCAAACAVLCAAYIGIGNFDADNITSDITDNSVIYTPKTENNNPISDRTNDANSTRIESDIQSSITPVRESQKDGATISERAESESGAAASGGVFDISRPTDNRLGNSELTESSGDISGNENTPSIETPKDAAEVDAPVMTPPPTDETDADIEQGVQVSNPFAEKDSLSEMQKEVGYTFKIPRFIPKGYKTDSMSVMFGSMIQISYTNDSSGDEILYRTEKTTGDISGDYSEYKNVENKKINNADVEIKSNDESCHTATWNDESAYSVYSRNGIDKNVMEKIVESVDYPKEEDIKDVDEQKDKNKNKSSENARFGGQADDEVKY